MGKEKQAYDLEERTQRFSKDIIRIAKEIPLTPTSRPLISQLVRAATSIGANYQEANGAVSKKDFRNKIFICKKECKETLYWLNIFDEITDSSKTELAKKECHELIKIFAKISITSSKNCV